jgi:phage tail sheath protein FI
VSASSLGSRAPDRFRLTVTYSDAGGRDTLQEVFDDLSTSPESPAFFERRVNGMSSLITIARNPTALARSRMEHSTHRDGEPPGLRLKGGAEGTRPVIGDYRGSDRPGERTGLSALAALDDISILCAPDDQSVNGLADAVVQQCERLADRFAIVNARAEDCVNVPELEPSFEADGKKTRIDSKYAAFYAPSIKIVDAATGRVRTIPPGGHVAGVYARSDIERGVWKAPANEVVRGAVGLAPDYSTGEQEILNPRGVNCIRALPGRGIRVWGARTTSSDPLWRYVNVRRLFLYIEESIDQGTQWVVFEPNDQKLWARVRQTVSDFLTTVWRSGALMGVTADEAFFVKCDETTMTQNDLMTGRLIVLIGVAPVRPAEFVIFRIAQWTRGAGETA